MIAEVGVAPLALLDISARNQRFSSRSLWAAWLDALHAHGSVVFASPADFDLMKQLLEGTELSPDEKKRWSEMLVFLKKNNRFRIVDPGLSVHLDDVAEPTQIAAIQHQLPLVAVLAQDAFVRLYPDNLDGSHPINSQTSASLTTAVSTAPEIGYLSRIALRERYPKGTDRDVIWGELFHAVSARSTRVTIVDRYAFSALRRAANHRRPAPPEHLAWLVEKVDRNAADGSRLQIIGELSTGESADNLLDLLRAAWKPRQSGRLKAVEAVGVVWDPRRHPHNRHIRFGSSWAFTLDEGLDRVSRPAVQDPSGFNFSFKWRKDHLDDLKETERLVQNDVLAQRATWTVRS